MTDRSAGRGPRRRIGAAGRCFIGSFVEGPDAAQVVLRGDIDTAAVARVREHVESLRTAGTRFLVIDAAAVDSYDQALLDLFGHTQSRLSGRRGMLQVRGLHPSLMADPEPPGGGSPGPLPTDAP